MSCSMRIASWAKIVQSENISTPIYVECCKMYRSKACVQEFSYFVSGLIFNLKNPSTTVVYAKKSVAGGEIRRVIYRFFAQLIRINGLVVKPGCRVRWVLKPSAVPRPFCVALSPSVHWHLRFLYCCALYNSFFSSLGFRQWRSRADRIVNLNTTIRLPLF